MAKLDPRGSFSLDAFGRTGEFEPNEQAVFAPTDAEPGSIEKIAVLAARVAAGVPLWHQLDRCDYSGIRCVARRCDQTRTSDKQVIKMIKLRKRLA